MVEIRPFHGLRFDVDRVGDLGRVVCPPYDVISPAGQAALYDRHPANVVRLEFARDEPGDPTPSRRHERAAHTLRAWLDEQILLAERQPAFYLHEIQFQHGGAVHTRRDLIAALRLEDWDHGVVLPHERTMRGPKADRLALMRATATNVSPVWLLHREHGGALAAAWAAAEHAPPAADFVDADGARHRLWTLADPALTEALRQQFHGSRIYMADGHHRYETALAYRDERRAATPSASGDEPWNFVLALLTAADDPGLVVLPTHRLLQHVERLDPDSIRSILSRHFAVETQPIPSGQSDEQVAALLLHLLAEAGAQSSFAVLGPDPTQATLLRPLRPDVFAGVLPADRSAAWRALDVARLDVAALEPLLHAAGVERESAVSFTRDAGEAAQFVRSGTARLALLLRATPVAQVLAVAEAHDRMPEKSTYFFPKPPTGLVLHHLDPVPTGPTSSRSG